MNPNSFPRLIGAAFVCFVLFLFSCSTAHHLAPTYSSAGFASTSTSTGIAYTEDGNLFDANQTHKLDKNPEENTSRKMIYEGELSMVVKNRDSVNKQIAAIATKSGGYLLSVTDYSTVIRVPSEGLNNIMDTIGTLGKVKSRGIRGQDVTERYYDSQMELETLEKTRARYLELLQKAERVTEILPIEKELERLNVQIDMLKGRLQKMDHSIAFTLITIRLENKVQPGPLGYVGIGLWKVVKLLFVIKS